MHPTRRFPDRTRLAVRQIQLVVAVIGVRLQDACVARQMRLRMLAPPIARVGAALLLKRLSTGAFEQTDVLFDVVLQPGRL